MCTDCNEITIPIGPTGPPGPTGPAGVASAVTVKDAQGHTVTNCTEIRFIDSDALVTNLGGGIATVQLVPAATVWNNLQGLNWYNYGTTSSFLPQYTIEGNKITFRGLLYLPLEYSGSGWAITNGNSYLSIPSAALDTTAVTVISNANNNNGTPQGRFITNNIVTNKNLPLNATPVNRDISFSNVPAYRRYSSDNVAVYRTVVDLKIGSVVTPFVNGTDVGSGCLMVFAPYQAEYDGNGTPPLGNDPLGLAISRVTGDIIAADYIASTDDDPFTVPAATAGTRRNAFTVNAHNILSLGGFIINLEGLSGYLN